MKLRQKIFRRFNPRKVKYLTINAMGLVGIAIAILAFVVTEDQTALVSQMSQQLFQSPVGVAISSITTLLFC